MQANGLGVSPPRRILDRLRRHHAGVLAHLPMFVHASHMGYQMAGMPMDATMLTGMGLIPFGLLLAACGHAAAPPRGRRSRRRAAAVPCRRRRGAEPRALEAGAWCWCWR